MLEKYRSHLAFVTRQALEMNSIDVYVDAEKGVYGHGGYNSKEGW